jgi:hypothetical protein
MTALGRHPNILMSLLLAAVGILVFVAVVGLGGPPPATDPSPSVASASVPASPSSPAPSSIPPAAPESPSMTEIAPGVMADCGQIGPAACERAIALARAGNEGDLVGTTLIVVDDICAPEVMCDRMFPFDSIVVFVTAGGDTTGWYAFHVVGTNDMPEKAERWQDDIPRHIVDRIRAALATP